MHLDFCLAAHEWNVDYLLVNGLPPHMLAGRQRDVSPLLPLLLTHNS